MMNAVPFELGDVYQSSPISFRFVKASPAYMSMMNGRDTMMIELIQLTRTEGGYELLAAYEEALYELGGRPHWGQVNTLTGSHGLVASMYPRYGDWLDVHGRLNASGVFDADLPVVRVLHDQQGVHTDCATSGCEIFAVDVTAIIFAARAPVAFDPTVPPPVSPSISVTPSTNLPFSGSITTTGADWAAFDQLQRRTTSPENAVRFLEQFGRIDVRDEAQQVACPTLIMHCRDDHRVPMCFGEELAALIPNSRLVALSSNNHLLTANEPAWQVFRAEVDAFLT